MPENAFDFLCVEPATLFRVDGYLLKPGESRAMQVTISASRRLDSSSCVSQARPALGG